jgi:hypothetical protein
MIYKEHHYFLCRVMLSATGPQDVEILDRAKDNTEFPALFDEFEKLKSPAYNEDDLYSIVRADEIYVLVRTPNNDTEAKEKAYEEALPNLITNLQHRVMQKNDAEARSILREVHDIEIN